MKRILLSLLRGLLMGISVQHLLSMIISAHLKLGYYAALPMLEEPVGGELYAVMLEALICGVLGASIAVLTALHRGKPNRFAPNAHESP